MSESESVRREEVAALIVEAGWPDRPLTMGAQDKLASLPDTIPRLHLTAAITRAKAKGDTALGYVLCILGDEIKKAANNQGATRRMKKEAYTGTNVCRDERASIEDIERMQAESLAGDPIEHLRGRIECLRAVGLDTSEREAELAAMLENRATNVIELDSRREAMQGGPDAVE